VLCRANAPEEARVVIEEEINKLRTLEPASSEFNVTRNYLDWLTSVPWGVVDEEKYDIEHAQTTLDADHHGLQVRFTLSLSLSLSCACRIDWKFDL
jgi:Lon-like ATP-dependent protease